MNREIGAWMTPSFEVSMNGTNTMDSLHRAITRTAEVRRRTRCERHAIWAQAVRYLLCCVRDARSSVPELNTLA